MARTEFKSKVKRDAFVRADGKCEGMVEGERCGCKLTIGKFAYDHVIPDWMGGEATLTNCQVLCDPCHKAKTKIDSADRATAKHREDAHRGIRPAPKRPMRSQGFGKAAPQNRASKPLEKWFGDAFPTRN